MTTRKSWNGGRRTRRRKRMKGGSANFIENDITSKFFEMLFLVKLFHWKTTSYATHKATDELYTKLNEHMDKFMELLLGKYPGRMNFSHKGVRAQDLNSNESLKNQIEDFKKYMESLTGKLRTKEDSDLLNLRDEVLGDLNQFLYLLTLK